jgi:hypothetical protein
MGAAKKSGASPRRKGRRYCQKQQGICKDSRSTGFQPVKLHRLKGRLREPIVGILKLLSHLNHTCALAPSPRTRGEGRGEGDLEHRVLLVLQIAVILCLRFAGFHEWGIINIGVCMTIKAILRDGRIQPLEPLPPDWVEGQELVVEEPESAEGEAQINQWAKELDKSTAPVQSSEHGPTFAAVRNLNRRKRR